MRRDHLLLAALLLAEPMVARAQLFPSEPREPRVPRAWLVLSDGVGRNAGGISNSSGLVQLFRASGTVAVTPSIGFELSALRTQVIFPANRLLNDPSLNSPKLDGLTLGVASLTGEGDGTRFPGSAVLGGALLRRPTNDPTMTKVTGGLMAGVESGLWRPGSDWVDTTAGLRLILMPSSNHRQIYILALTLGARFG
jgi:hypothetical protein